VKYISSHTLRGSVTDDNVVKLNLFDGRFDTGYRVTRIHAFTSDPSASNSDGWITVATEEEAAIRYWDAHDQRQIGWTGFHTTTFGGGYEPQQIIDRDNMIIMDLYIYGNTSPTASCNFIIELDKYDITEWQGALNIVKNSSQG